MYSSNMLFIITMYVYVLQRYNIIITMQKIWCITKTKISIEAIFLLP